MKKRRARHEFVSRFAVAVPVEAEQIVALKAGDRLQVLIEASSLRDPVRMTVTAQCALLPPAAP